MTTEAMCSIARRHQLAVGAPQTSANDEPSHVWGTLPVEPENIGSAIRFNESTSPCGVDPRRMGMDVEREHGVYDPQTDVTGDHSAVTLLR